MGQNKGKQFNLSKREALSRMIRDKKTAREIAAALGMDPTSVSREVMRNRRKSAPELDDGTACRGCEYRIGCTVHHACGRRECGLRCASCKAMRSCPRFSPFRCPVERRWPLCCNGCPRERRCTLDHWHYLPDEADSAAREGLSESRSGADMTPEELRAMDEALREAVAAKGQSIHHALLANKDAIGCSEKTAYRRIAAGILSVRNADLPRQPGLKKRKRGSLADRYAYRHADSVDRTGHLVCLKDIRAFDKTAFRPVFA
jgi:IS30 family transposase